MKTLAEVIGSGRSVDGAAIILAGQTWTVPPKMKGYQVKKAAPLVYSIMARIVKDPGLKITLPNQQVVQMPPFDEGLLQDLVHLHFWGLRENYPELTLDHFEVMEFTPIELMGNLAVFQEAAGFKAAVQPTGGAPDVKPPGEDGAPAN